MFREARLHIMDFWGSITFYFQGYPDRGQWELTPWWHDEYSIAGTYDGEWKYSTYEECAHQALRERCDCPTRRKPWEESGDVK